MPVIGSLQHWRHTLEGRERQGFSTLCRDQLRMGKASAVRDGGTEDGDGRVEWLQRGTGQEV